jgi:hypothetical protein
MYQAQLSQRNVLRTVIFVLKRERIIVIEDSYQRSDCVVFAEILRMIFVAPRNATVAIWTALEVELLFD